MNQPAIPKLVLGSWSGGPSPAGRYIPVHGILQQEAQAWQAQSPEDRPIAVILRPKETCEEGATVIEETVRLPITRRYKTESTSF
jgi:hypothetical protein